MMNSIPHPRSTGRPRAAGFTLIELLVSFTILVLILVAVLTLFERNSRIARTQTHVADLQQAVRVSQHQLVRNIRMAGRGPLPMYQFGTNPNQPSTGKFLPTGVAVEVWNDAAAGNLIAGAGSPEIAVNSDVLVVRGVINGSLYQLNPGPGSFGGTGGTGFVQVQSIGPTGVPQDLDSLCEGLLAAGGGGALPTALVISSTLSDESYAVVEATGATGCGAGAASVLITFTTQGEPAAQYLALSPNGVFPPDLTSAAFVGVVEEYRYYVRQENNIVTDLTQLVPGADFVRRLSRARVYPNTNRAYADAAANLMQDLADNVIDLQVALGVEDATDGDEIVLESVDDPGTDEWLFNATADDDTDTCRWNGDGAGCANTEPNRLYYVRVTTVGRTDRPEPGWIDPAIGFIEDHNYAESPGPQSPTETNQRRFRRWSLTTTVDLRNLS